MPIDFVCPKCSTDLEAPDGTGGAVTRCPTCGTALLVPTSEPAPVEAPPITSATDAWVSSGSGDVPLSESDAPDPHSPTPAAAAKADPPEKSGHAAKPKAANAPTPSALVPDPSSASMFFARHSAPKPAEEDVAEVDASSSSDAPARGAPLEDETPGDVYQLARPAPRWFSTPAAIVFGAKLMQRQLVPFSWANMAAVALAAVAAVLFFSRRFSPAAGPALVGWLAFVGPPTIAGIASLSLRAARGRPMRPLGLFASFRRFFRVWTYFTAWALLMTVCIAPAVAATAGTWMTGRRMEAVGLGLLTIFWTMLVGARLGWFPFVFWDQPNANFSALIGASVAVGRGQTMELMRLSLLVFAAIAGTNIGIVVVGLPLAMGVAGATYVLLARQSARGTGEAVNP